MLVIVLLLDCERFGADLANLNCQLNGVNLSQSLLLEMINKLAINFS